METEKTSTTPTGIILISLFWVLVGTWLLALNSQYLTTVHGSYVSLLAMIPLAAGMGLIVVGWGLLVFRKWAYYTALILSVICVGFLLLFNIIYLGYRLFSDWHYVPIDTIFILIIPFALLWLFIFIFLYLIKCKKYYENRQ
jgi:hypothetical protein